MTSSDRAIARYFSLEGKAALVTGASGGIGPALAVGLAGAGAAVGLHGRSEPHLAETAREVEAAGGRSATLIADLNDPAACARLVEDAEGRLGRLDVLVNCAGMNRRMPIERVGEDDYDTIMGVNLRSAFFLSRTARAAMKRQGGGKIVHLASLTSTIGPAGTSVYGMSKAALAQLAKTQAVEWATDNIQVNCLAPGFIRTPLTEASVWGDDRRRAWLLGRIPAKRGNARRHGRGAPVHGRPRLVLPDRADDHRGRRGARRRVVGRLKRGPEGGEVGMRLGIGSYTYGWSVGTDADRPPGALSALDLIDHARALGVSLVQLCDNLPASTWDDDSVRAIAAKAGGAGVRVQVGTRGSLPDHLRRFAAIARRLGSPVLRVVIDDGDDRPEPDEVVRRLRAVVADFERTGVTLALENHDRFRAATLAQIVRDADSPRVGVCLDTVNSFGALEGPRVVVETLGPLVVNLHLKDFAVARMPHHQGFVIEGRPLGRGMLDVPWLLGMLGGSFGRDPDAIIEHWTPPEPDIQATVRKEQAWAEESVRAARRWIAD